MVEVWIYFLFPNGFHSWHTTSYYKIYLCSYNFFFPGAPGPLQLPKPPGRRGTPSAPPTPRCAGSLCRPVSPGCAGTGAGAQLECGSVRDSNAAAGCGEEPRGLSHWGLPLQSLVLLLPAAKANAAAGIATSNKPWWPRPCGTGGGRARRWAVYIYWRAQR